MDIRPTQANLVGQPTARPIQHGSISSLADTLLLARADPGDQVDPYGRAVFWIGAGASITAGIPSGRALAGRLAQRIAAKLGYVTTPPDCEDVGAHEAAFAELQRAGKVGPHLALGTAYGELFAKLSANEQRDFIRRVIVRTNRRQINWAHMAIGELVRQRVVHTLLTTNFDDLLLDGMMRCDQLPAIIDGVDSLNRMDPQPPVPQLVYLHGSQHTYSPRNSSDAVLSTRNLPQAQGGLYGLLQHCSVLVVVGYAGNAGEGVMELMQQCCRALPELPIYWISHGQQDGLSPAAAELLSSAKNGHLIPGQDADLFFRGLLREMRIGVPAWFRGPVGHLLHLADRISVEPTPQNAELLDEVEDFRQRLKELLPIWEQVGAENHERRVARQLMLSSDHRAVWERLRDQSLEDVALLQMRAESAYELGHKGLEDTLERSVRDWAAVVRRYPTGSAEWGLAQDRLGNALAKLGERKMEERALRDAIAAFEAALSVHDRNETPFKWAATRSSQGSAFLALLQVTGTRADDDCVESARLAFSETLEVYRFDATPAEWTIAKRSIGHVLRLCGQSDDGGYLEESIEAYAEVMQAELSIPGSAERALTACHRAVALIDLGLRRRDRDMLAQAIEILGEAVEAVTHESDGLRRAVLEYHHGIALLALGQLGDLASLRESMTVLRNALAIQLSAPPGPVVDWATTYAGLEGAWWRLGANVQREAVREAVEVLNRASEQLDGECLPGAQEISPSGLADHVRDELRRVVAGVPAPVPGMRLGAPTFFAASTAGESATRVMIVEDDRLLQILLTKWLKTFIANVELSIHTHGLEACAEEFRFSPHLLILDLNLPDMQGGDLLTSVRTTNPSLPVLLYSSDVQAMMRLKRNAKPGAAIEIFRKGLDTPDDFRRLIFALFNRRNRDKASGIRSTADAYEAADASAAAR